jgi:hypothetical protein
MTRADRDEYAADVAALERLSPAKRAAAAVLIACAREGMAADELTHLGAPVASAGELTTLEKLALAAYRQLVEA